MKDGLNEPISFSLDAFRLLNSSITLRKRLILVLPNNILTS